VDDDRRSIRGVADVLRLLDGLFDAAADRWSADAGGRWWDGFYEDRDKPIPFFANRPDENLVEYLERGLIRPRRVLELGCGPGRNALFLASRGCSVDAVDLSPAAIAWAAERAAQTGPGAQAVRFHCGDAFELTREDLTGPYDLVYDLVYDSGCFHHLPPHRRISYLQLLDRVLAPGGHLGLVCFASGAMGSELPDETFYRDTRLHGGLAYTPGSPRRIFAGMAEIELRRMRAEAEDAACFGEDFLWTALFRRTRVV
jgi:SAM-dependent methyltransferase